MVCVCLLLDFSGVSVGFCSVFMRVCWFPSSSSWPAPLLQSLDGSAEPVGGDGCGCYGAVGRDYEECGNPSQLPVGERRVLTRPFQVADLCPGEFLLAQHVLPCRSVEVEAEAQPSQRYTVDLGVGIVVVESLEPRYLAPAVAAPCRPEVDDDVTAPIAVKRHDVAQCVGGGKWGSGVSRLQLGEIFREFFGCRDERLVLAEFLLLGERDACRQEKDCDER